MEEIITLMTVTYNRLELTKKTFEGLIKSNKTKCNLVIIDNGSTDGSVEYLKSLNEGLFKNTNYNVHLVLLPENLGIGAGRNIALKKADELKTSYYCTIDNDVEMPDGWLDECIDVLKGNKSFGAIGVNMEGVNYTIVNKNGIEFQEKPAGNLGTACMVFKKQVHQAIGFFKKYNKYGLEDSDFGMRARIYGFKLGYIVRSGIHLGVGEYDCGDYRKFKTLEHDSRVAEFKNNCYLYTQKKLPIYVPYQEKF